VVKIILVLVILTKCRHVVKLNKQNVFTLTDEAIILPERNYYTCLKEMFRMEQYRTQETDFFPP